MKSTTVLLAGAVAFGAATAADAPAQAQPWTTIDGHSCIDVVWREETSRSVPTKRARKRAIRRARRQWERGVRQTYGDEYATLANSKRFSEGCSRQGVCHVTATPCSPIHDKPLP